MLFGNKNKKTSGNPTWLKWAVLVFIAYAIFMNYTERQKRGDAEVLSVSTPEASGEGNTLKRADFGSYTLPAGMTIGGDIPGIGEEASCGQKATLSVQELTGDDAQPLQKQEVQLQVGTSDADHPWAAGLVGMKPSGVRQIRTASETSAHSFKVELLALAPSSGTGIIPFQAAQRLEGSGAVAQCGAQAEIHLTIWGHDGAVLFDSRHHGEGNPLRMRIGASEIMYGLDRGVLSMKRGEKRMLIIPPAFSVLGEAEGNPLRGIISQDSVVLAELSLMDVHSD